MRTINITDLIGSYCGMHYYDESFAELLKEEGYRVRILSNFSSGKESAFFPVLFRSSKFISVCLLLFCYFKMVWHMITHRKDIYIYLCYGELYDLLMMSPSIWCKRMLCDVHEVHALKYADNSFISSVLNVYFKKVVRIFIYHSQRTKDILDNLGATSPMLYVPHFKYLFKKSYDDSFLDEELKNSFKDNKTKFLFFGNLSVVKGVDIVISTFANLSHEIKDKVELVIAGKNVDNIDFSSLRASSENYKVYDRHINDDELVYLYMNADYVLLPYKKSSQSGIFAMAEYFRKPMILSDIPYFQKMISEFPSFGIISPLEDFQNVIESVVNKAFIPNFYTIDDCNKSENKEEIISFASQLKRQIT